MKRTSQEYGQSIKDMVDTAIRLGKTTVNLPLRSDGIKLQKEFYGLRNAYWEEGNEVKHAELLKITTGLKPDGVKVKVVFTYHK